MKARRQTRRAGFTLIELLVAGIITSLVLASVAFSLSNLAGSKNSAKRRMQAFLRADAALESLRSDVASVLRKSDLFFTRFVIEDDRIATDRGTKDRDMILLFSTKLRSIHEIDFTGEGMEYETQYRVIEDQLGPVLWQRRDAVPDEFYDGGGYVTPIAEGVISISFEAYDGEEWLEYWDSDIDGLPLAVRITVEASGHGQGEDCYASNMPLAMMRTVVAIDRVPPPPPPEPEEDEEGAAEDGLTGDGENGGAGASGATGRDVVQPGQGRPGSGPGDGRGPGSGRGDGRGRGRGRGGRGADGNNAGGGRGTTTDGGSSSSSSGNQRVFTGDS